MVFGSVGMGEWERGRDGLGEGTVGGEGKRRGEGKGRGEGKNWAKIGSGGHPLRVYRCGGPRGGSLSVTKGRGEGGQGKDWEE